MFGFGMYRNRFKTGKKRRLIDLPGKFSLIHLGGGNFILSLRSGKEGVPRVLRLELGRRKHVRGYGAVLLAALLFGGLFMISRAGTADTVSLEELERKSGGLTPLELDDKSERLKQKLLADSYRKSASSGSSRIKSHIEYTVIEGDTLSEIARRYRVPIEMVTASSRIRINSVLRPGQKLVVPTRRGLVYKIKRGDRLAAVADYYSVKLGDILAENPNLESLDAVPMGERVFLPNAKIPAPPPVWFRPAWGRLTSRFGWRRHPIHRKLRRHSGVDIGMSYGNVRAARSGHVTFAGLLGSYGHTIIMEHTGGYKTLYAHLSRIYVKKGQYIKARVKIARSGNSGLSTGPHLHFEIIRYGRPINPRKKVRF